MAQRKIKVSRSLLLATLLAVAVLIFLLPQALTKNLNFRFHRIFNPILRLGRAVEPEFTHQPYTKKAAVSKYQYNRLLAEYDNTIAALRKVHSRYEKLAQIRTQLPQIGSAMVLAEVSQTTLTPHKRQVIINKGQIDNLKDGQYVLANKCIIGAIEQTYRTWSQVRLVTDPLSSMEVVIWQEKNNAYINAQLVGQGGRTCKIPLLSRQYDISIGDTVYAAARPQLLEVPVVIGKITQLEPGRQQPLLWDITVEPLLDTDELTEVAVVVMNHSGS